MPNSWRLSPRPSPRDGTTLCRADENSSKSLNCLATPGGLEPPTFSLEGCCSIQLSYGAGSRAKSTTCRRVVVAFGTWRHAALFSWRSAAHMVGEGDFMTDDRSKAGPADRSRINVHQDHEVQYWTNAL